jgi:hypothetical protein
MIKINYVLKPAINLIFIYSYISIIMKIYLWINGNNFKLQILKFVNNNNLNFVEDKFVAHDIY